MEPQELTSDLHRYLQDAREALVWKLEGVSGLDARRPLTPTGTNLLGLVKHCASVETGYLGDTFGRPFEEPLPWLAEGAEVDADMWATPEEPREDIVALYRRVWAHGDATVAALGPDAVGRVPWWPAERAEVTVHRVLAHLVAETQRHAGHADILRELLDGTAGLRRSSPNLQERDQEQWVAFRARLQEAAEQAAAVDHRERGTGIA